MSSNRVSFQLGMEKAAYSYANLIDTSIACSWSLSPTVLVGTLPSIPIGQAELSQPEVTTQRIPQFACDAGFRAVSWLSDRGGRYVESRSRRNVEYGTSAPPLTARALSRSLP